MRDEANAFLWIKETHWRRWDLPGTQNRTSVANTFFRVHKSSSATGASEQLLELLLLKELSAAGAFSAASGMGGRPRAPLYWGDRIFKISVPLSYRDKFTICKKLRGTEILKMRSPQWSGARGLPPAENAPAADSFPSSSGSSSSSSSCSEDDSWTQKKALATEVLFWVPGRSQRRQCVSFIHKNAFTWFFGQQTHCVTTLRAGTQRCACCVLKLLRMVEKSSPAKWWICWVWPFHSNSRNDYI